MYGYDVATQSGHAHDHHAHQKNRGKPNYGDAHCLKAHSENDDRLAFGVHVAVSVAKFQANSGAPKHASNDHPSGELHHADRRYGGDGSDRHDANGDLRNDDCRLL